MPRPRTMDDDDVLEAAGRAIGRMGAARLTLAHVAEESGLSPSTLVQRFGSKRGMLVAFAKRAASAAPGVFERAREAHASPLAALLGALAAMAEGIDSPETLGNHLSLLQLDLSDPEMGGHAAEHARATREGIAALLARAAEAGELVVGDPEADAWLVKAVYDGALIGWAVEGDGPVDVWLRREVGSLLDGWRPAGP